jgi:hypothetical protein
MNQIENPEDEDAKKLEENLEGVLHTGDPV